MTWAEDSDDETGFEVYRTTASAARSGIRQQAGARIGEVGADATSFVDLDVELEQAYRYSVVAVRGPDRRVRLPRLRPSRFPSGST